MIHVRAENKSSNGSLASKEVFRYNRGYFRIGTPPPAKAIHLIYLYLFLSAGCVDLSDNDKTTPGTLPIQTSFKVEDFTSATECAVCHPQHYAEWSSSMHAYSIMDPVWISLQNKQQVHNLNNGVEIGDFCIQCHSPAAALTDLVENHIELTAEVINTFPPQVKEGVTCDACHLTTHLPDPTNISIIDHDYETVDFKLYSSDTRYGILDDPVENEFHNSVYHSGYDKSEFCQNCHNLTVDERNAEITQFEWEGTAFQAMGMECQSCHMPTYAGQATVDGPERDNLHRHFFPGIDEALIDFPGKNEQRQAIEDLLQTAAEINFFDTPPDTITAGIVWDAKLIVSNNTGHNFPSGTTFPRQLWIELIATIGNDTLLTSGWLDANGDLLDFYTDPSGEQDPQLRIFNTILYDAQGDSGLLAVSVENMVAMTDRTLPVSGSRTINYSINIPVGIEGELLFSAKLRFRSFPPFYLRHLDLESLIGNVHIFDIDSLTQTLYVSSI